MFKDDWELGCLSIALILVAFGLVLGIGAASFDIYQGRASFSAQADCRTHQLEPMRNSFSREVRCVPFQTRQDTTTIRVPR